MSSEVSINFKGEYIHITHQPDFKITLENMKKLWTELSQACKKHKCWKAFHEGPAPEREMTLTDSFQSGQKVATSIPGLKLAVCLYGYATDESTTLFINVAYNRGVQVEFFEDRREALEWLGVKDTD
jgi:hypothetical protein